MAYIQHLAGPAAPERSQIGGKGAALSRMVSAGVPVPPGFVVTTAAYLDFVALNGLDVQIDHLLDGVDHDDAEQLSAAATQIRDRILRGDLPEGLEELIVKSYESLAVDDARPFVAVRSSGTAEDMGDASFAGLYDSYLDVRGTGDVVSAVRRCWASLWTARCASYRHRLGLENSEAQVAVVVQQMVAPECAGVLFTANPLTERTDEIVINSTWGLGEAIASGIVTPDEFVLDVETLVVKRSILGSKEWRIDRAGDATGTVKTETSNADRAVFSLDAEGARRLADIGKRILALAEGIPQDIEWALSNGEFYIVQSRDITGAEFLWDEDVESWQTAPDPEDAVWSHAWAKTYWNGAVTPLFYSLRGREMRNSDERLFTLWGFEDLAKMRRYKYRRSTVYFSSDADRIYYRYVLPAQLRRHWLGNLPPDWHADAGAAPTSVGKLLRMHARVRALSTDQGPLRSIKSIYAFIEENTEAAHKPTAEELRHFSDAELKREIARKVKMFEDYLTILRPAFHIYSTTAFGILRELLAAWYDGGNEYAFQDLISGLPKRTAMLQEQIDLWELAKALRSSPQLVDLLDASADGQDFFARIRKVDYAADFLARYDAFLEEHGHRGQQDRDIWYPRRSEDPDIDYRALVAMVAADAPSPVENEHRLTATRLATTEEVLASIHRKPFGSIRVELFKAVVDYIHKFLVLRDDERPFADAVTMAKKRGVLELGRRLHERGLTERPDDFYFLSEYELYELLEGKAQRKLTSAKITNRRKVFDAFLARTEVPADYLLGNSAMEVDDGTHTGIEGVFQAVAMSRGTVTGTARIVGDLSDIGRVTRNDILVCNSTDPGWTPVFGLISGLVLESGGMLSHGACLSREYGLPAVTLPNAMQRIPDGATITVNGDSGRVTVVDAGGDHA